MFSRDSEDKNHLAMLAIPVILSMLIGFSGDASASEILEVRGSESKTEESNTQESGATIPTSSDHNIQELVVDDSDSRRKELEKSVVNGDYERFLTLSSDTPFAEIMTETVFNEVMAQYQLHKAGYRVSRFTID